MIGFHNAVLVFIAAGSDTKAIGKRSFPKVMGKFKEVLDYTVWQSHLLRFSQTKPVPPKHASLISYCMDCLDGTKPVDFIFIYLGLQ